ncbi:thiol:disulfide interchange protein DsbA/DsbL [Limnobacter sp. 130]|jgi:protein dithiol oxidoreductase (disulfide-forming)|uniref:thiol:disulfide interchange protein DsbA/DsbL n=1 Tax=Limnobacter sp. 130 TaxID=2653147 RepID=UPI0012EFBF2D|nr:thiol:disulfide interchange protein DsbA/DsbL [Limnobacter sp. 130]VWX34546.1 Thiol:disulfide interchange protein [Limnobacter sp. 130]
MKRRELIQSAVALGVVSALGGLSPALAQDAGAFRKVRREVPRSTPGKIDVVEFFWYGCIHCYNFEPKVNAWYKKLPSDVVFTKIPIAYQSQRVNFQGHQRLYYTLEAMGKLDMAHSKVFEAMHKDKKQLANDEQIFDFAESLGLKREEFANMFKSFGVNAKCAQAKSIFEAYGADGVPTLGVDGKFFTSASIAGSEDNAIRVAEALIRRQRQA